MSETEDQVPADPIIVEIATDSDITLLIGGSGETLRRLKVSSQLLKIVSKYFASILGPQWRESEAFARGEDVQLKGDDAVAMTTLCQILHMQHDALECPMSATDLLGLAVVADKYQCTKALSLTLEAIFPKKLASDWSMETVGRLVAASYLLDHPALFQRFTTALVRGFVNPFIELAFGRFGTLVPMQAWLMLEEQRAAVRVALVEDFFALGNICVGNDSRCIVVADLAASLATTYRRAGLAGFPIASKSIGALANLIENLPETTTRQTARCLSNFEHLIPPRPKEYKELVGRINCMSKGLCLDCVRAGGRNVGVCRFPHRVLTRFFRGPVTVRSNGTGH